jgi:hypothetical protein
MALKDTFLQHKMKKYEQLKQQVESITLEGILLKSSLAQTSQKDIYKFEIGGSVVGKCCLYNLLFDRSRAGISGYY